VPPVVASVASVVLTFTHHGSVQFSSVSSRSPHGVSSNTFHAHA